MNSWFGGWSGLGSQVDAGAPPTLTNVAPLGTSLGGLGLGAGSSEPFQVGEIVEYWSASQNNWILAKILAANSSGTYNLDCKPEVPKDKIRRRGADAKAGSSFAGAQHAVGDIVEYQSASQGRWIPAKVLAVNSAGTFDLDCKPQVPPEKVRRPQSGGGAAGSSIPPPAQPSAGGYAPPPRAAAGEQLAAPVQLLRVQRNGSKWRYEVCPEGAEMLERHGSRRIAVASVCGLYRTGKSFLMNILLERTQKGLPPFQVGSTTRACTEGLWLWGNADSEDDQSPLLVFMDCEGFGSTESDRTRDAQLMTLCALMSSVLVLNTKGTLNEGLFNALALVCRFAEHIEERGSETSRPALLWVLRDFMLELRDESGSHISPDEYLEQALHSAPSVGMDRERGQAGREVRQSLLRFFSQRSCATLVQPASDEVQLQRLDRAQYSSLRPEFRAGVEALRGQLTSACRASPKTVGGQPIGCFAFVQMVRQLVDAMNDSKMLNIRGAWEAVQHTACRGLLDELRVSGSQTLRALATGQQILGGAQLPMTDEALRMVLRDRRHSLKAQWDERAVGDEAVRKEYWQELKEALAREEQQVRTQNSRLADQRLMEMLKGWQEWLDDDAGALAAGERLSDELGQLMDRVPAAPLSRGGRQAIEAAARRVAAARTAVAATLEQSSEAQRRAMAWGEQAAQKEGAARSEVESRRAELSEVQERVKRAQHAERDAQNGLSSVRAELHEARVQLQAALKDVEDARLRESELTGQHTSLCEKEVGLRDQLDQVRASVAAAEAERLASERVAKAAADATAAEHQRLTQEVQASRAEAERFADLLASERAVLRSENDRTRNEQAQMVDNARRQLESERTTLKGETEKTRAEHQRMVEEARRQLEQERGRHTEALEAEQQRLLEKERSAGLLEGQVATLSSEASSLRDRIAEMQVTLREAEAKAARQRQEIDRSRADTQKARAEASRTREQASRDSAALKKEHEARMEEVMDRARKKGCFRPSGGKHVKAAGA
jgi:hypothetical protein